MGAIFSFDMRVLLVNKFHFLKGGAERAVFDIAELLRSHGHEVAFLSMKHPENRREISPITFVNEADYHKKHSFFQSARLALRILWNFEAEKKMEKLLGFFQPDIVHFHDICRELSPSVIRPVTKRGIPSVMTLHDYSLLSPSRTLFSKGKGAWTSPVPSILETIRDPFVQSSRVKSLLALLEYQTHRITHAYGSISMFIAPSRFLKNTFEQSGFFGRIASMSNPLLDARDRRERARLERNTPQQSAPFVFVGRLSEEKGIGILLEAFAKYVGYSSLLVVGDGPDAENLLKRAGELRLLKEKKVVFVGRKDSEERDRILLASKALVVPSLWYENQPYVVMEALSLGVPVVVSDVGALPDMIDQGENGFSYRSEDAESLARLLEAIDRKTPSEWIRMKESALRRAQSYDGETFFLQLLDIYKDARKG